MKRIWIFLGVAALSSPAVAAPMEEACLARGTWSGETCACIQGVADDHLAPERQELAAAYFSRQITSQQIAAQHGADVAQDFLASIAAFMSASTAQCGAP